MLYLKKIISKNYIIEVDIKKENIKNKIWLKGIIPSISFLGVACLIFFFIFTVIFKIQNNIFFQL